MKKSLLTLVVFFFATIAAFADASGSGTASATEASQKGVKYTYTFTESGTSVTFNITPDGTNVVGYVTPTYIDDKTSAFAETTGDTKTWENIAPNTVIKLTCWWAVAGGRSTTDEITYTVKGSSEPDTEKPVMTKVEATTVKDTKATLTLSATDNSVSLTYTVKNGETVLGTITGNQGSDATIDITGLTANTAYTLSVTAKDAAGNESDAKDVSFTTAEPFKLTAPQTPNVDASKVLSVYSDKYTPATTWKVGEWGQTTKFEEVSVDGQKIMHFTDFNYLGLEYGTDLDLSTMTNLHFDVLPITNKNNLRVTPIMRGGTKTEDPQNAGTPSTLKTGEWNSIDMPLTSFALDYSGYKSHQIKFDAFPQTKDDELYIANIYFYSNRTGEETLKSMTLSSRIAPLKDGKLTTTASLTGSDGTAYQGDVTYTVSEGATLTSNGNALTITTDKAGIYTVTASSNGSSATADVAFIESTAAPTDDANSVLNYYSSTYGEDLSKLTMYDKGWERGYSSYEEITLAEGDKAILVHNVGTWGPAISPNPDATKYTKLCADIYSLSETPINIVWESTNVPAYNGTLSKGWNHIEIGLENYVRTAANFVKFNIGTDAKHDYDIVFDNIYASAAGVSFNVTIADNTAKVVGSVTSETVAEINNADAMAIDLTKATSIAEGATISPKHVNAIIVVPGTYSNDTNTLSDEYSVVKDINNLVVLGQDGWYRPMKQLQFADVPGEPLWQGEGINKDFISTGNTGWKLTRTIPANSYATIFSPWAISDIPEAISIWEATASDENTITFAHVISRTIGAAFPYVIYNSSNENADISYSGTGDINFNSWIDKDASSKAIGSNGVTFAGNYKETFSTDGSQWILTNKDGGALFVNANGPKVSPFRAYLTGLKQNSAAKAVFVDTPTSIDNIIPDAINKSGNIYNLSGQRVDDSYKGIIIKNGKKYIRK